MVRARVSAIGLLMVGVTVSACLRMHERSSEDNDAEVEFSTMAKAATHIIAYHNLERWRVPRVCPLEDLRPGLAFPDADPPAGYLSPCESIDEGYRKQIPGLDIGPTEWVVDPYSENSEPFMYAVGRDFASGNTISTIVLCSVGPDGKRDIWPKDIEWDRNGFVMRPHENVYDPTNGTQSRGDIVVYGDLFKDWECCLREPRIGRIESRRTE